MKILFLIFSVYLTAGDCFLIFCQDDSTFDSDQNIENILEESSLDNEESQILDKLEYLKDNPININQAAANDLYTIPFMDIITAEQILKYVKNSGQVFSVNELYLIKGIDKTVLSRIIPFLTANTRTEIPGTNEFQLFDIKKLQVNIRSRLLNDIQERRGFTEKKYYGNKIKTYNRIKVKYNKNIQLGYLAEKDAGEKSLTDFQTFHFLLKDIGLLKKLVIGDYNLEFGQGLALSDPYGNYKGGNSVTSVIKADKFIVPYLSTNENQFFRGIAATLAFNNFGLTVFYSNHNIDAGIDTITNEIISLVIDGYHRTESEINKYHKTNEKLYGGIINFSLPKFFSLGVSYYKSEFSYPLAAKAVYNTSGNKFDCLSVSYKIMYGNLYFSGETAWNNSISSIYSLQLKITESISTIVSVRNYSKEFNTLYSSGFAERQTKNESGVYTGMNLKTSLGNFNFFFDLYKFPWASYNNPLPIKGREFYLNYDFIPLKRLLLSLRYKNEKRELPGYNSDGKSASDQVIQSVKTQFEYRISPQCKIKTRFDYTNFQITGTAKNEKGILIYQNFHLTLFNGLSINSRVIFFQTDSYNSRLYEYENDVPGVLSNSVLTGKGLRWYTIIEYQIFNLATLSFKYSETFKPNEKTMGAGYQEINGDLDNRLSFQIDVEF